MARTWSVSLGKPPVMTRCPHHFRAHLEPATLGSWASRLGHGGLEEIAQSFRERVPGFLGKLQKPQIL